MPWHIARTYTYMSRTGLFRGPQLVGSSPQQRVRELAGDVVTAHAGPVVRVPHLHLLRPE